jgi:hypothetical protein
MVNRSPHYSLIVKKSDLLYLNPGDRVHISIESNCESPQLMVYNGNNLGKCSFIKIPENYRGEDVETFLIWESDQKFIGFSDTGILLRNQHRNLRVVHRESKEYASVKGLVNCLK